MGIIGWIPIDLNIHAMEMSYWVKEKTVTVVPIASAVEGTPVTIGRSLMAFLVSLTLVEKPAVIPLIMLTLFLYMFALLDIPPIDIMTFGQEEPFSTVLILICIIIGLDLNGFYIFNSLAFWVLLEAHFNGGASNYNYSF